LVAVAALMVAATGASANPITFPADPGFAAGSAWTASSTCNLLCTATGTQPPSGGNAGGQALASYSTVATVLGLATGSVDFTSSGFSWAGDSPVSASLHVDAKASLGALPSLGGSANATISLTDVTTAHTTNLKSLSFAASQAWTGTDVPVPSSLLTVGHSYKLTIHTAFSATLALLGGASVAYDNVSLAATRAVPVVSGPVVGTPTTTAVHIGAGADTAGADATYHLEYGATTSYGATTGDAALAGASGVQPIGVSLSGLSPLSTYHARFVVTTDAGTGYGPDISFATAAIGAPVLPLVPHIGAVTVTVDDAHAAAVSAVVQSNGLLGTDYRFEYGTTTAYGSTTPTIAVPAADSGGWSILERLLTGLSPSTTYHVRASVRLSVLWFHGADTAFATPAEQAPPVDPPDDPPADPPVDQPVDPPVDPPVDQPGNPPVDTPVGTPAQTTSHGGGATTATATPAAPAAVPATTTAPIATTAAVPPVCRAVRILSRTRGVGVQMENFVTAGAPLAITPRPKAKSIKRVTVDGKAVVATVKGRKVSLGAARLKPGRHVIRVGSGAHAAGLGVAIVSCRSSLAVRTAAGRSRIVLAAVPGTSSAAFALPKAYDKALGSGTLSVRANGKTKSVAIKNRTAFSAAAGVKVIRTGASVTISGLPANVTDVRLVLKTKRLAARGVSATVATAKTAARLQARAIGTKVR
jgi:hypothetical protein